MFEAALQNKVINEPDSFKQGIDYTTAITNSQKDKPDYYLTRGFINILAIIICAVAFVLCCFTSISNLTLVAAGVVIALVWMGVSEHGHV